MTPAIVAAIVIAMSFWSPSVVNGALALGNSASLQTCFGTMRAANGFRAPSRLSQTGAGHSARHAPRPIHRVPGYGYRVLVPSLVESLVGIWRTFERFAPTSSACSRTAGARRGGSSTARVIACWGTACQAVTRRSSVCIVMHCEASLVGS